MVGEGDLLEDDLLFFAELFGVERNDFHQVFMFNVLLRDDDSFGAEVGGGLNLSGKKVDAITFVEGVGGIITNDYDGL